MSKDLPDVLFDRAVEAVRDDAVDDEVLAGARARVWDKITGGAAQASDGEPIRGCADVRALFPRYRSQALGEARRMLVADHLRECAACRQAFADRKVVPWRRAPVASGPAPSLRRYAVAASLLVVAGGGAWFFRDAFTTAPSGPRATLESADGPVYLLARDGQRAVQAPSTLAERQWLRTPRGTSAVVRLRDGSRVEMREHTELGVTMNRHDLTVHLERGSVIVRAAKREQGHLTVQSEDVSVVVTGTVFSVNRGTKGTRVSVLEGAVQVLRGGERRALVAGEQYSTTRDVQAIPIGQEIAWSPQVDQYAGLLGEIATLDKKLETVRWPELRYQSQLLQLVPPGTLAVAAFPNYGDALEQVYGLFQARLDASPALQSWWRDSGGHELKAALPEVVAKVHTMSQYLGDEIVLSLVPSAGEDKLRPLLLAQVRRPGLRQALEAALPGGVRILDERGLAGDDGAPPAKLYVLVTDTLVAVSTDRESLRAGAAFPSTAFGQRVTECYRDGVGVLVAADLQAIASSAVGKGPATGPHAVDARNVMRELGADDARYLVIEQEKLSGVTQNRATLSFVGPRRGMASWLAAPAPMGSLDFVTPGASFAAAFIVKEPAQIVDDLFRVSETMNAEARASFSTLEARLGVQLREDVARPLGNDVAFAIDGPLLPVPSWKLVVEVHDPDRLGAALDKVVSRFNGGGARIERSQSRGRTIFSLSVPGVPTVVRWLFADGYLVAGPTEESLQRAVRARESGQHLRGSRRFRELIPSDRQANFSAVVYHNLGQAGAAVADWVGRGNALRPEQRDILERFAASSRPALVYVYGEEHEIQVASAGGFFGLGLDHFMGSAGLADLLRRQGSQ